MHSVDLAIAGIGIRLNVADGLVSPLEREFGAFVGGDPDFTLEVIEDSVPATANVGPTTLARNGDFVTLSSGSFVLSVDRARRSGLLRYRLPGVRQGLPVGIDGALKPFVALQLADSGGLLLHASAVELTGGAVMFVGVSGAGKSTVSSMFGKPSVLNDEMVAVVSENGTAWTHSTPFIGSMPLIVSRRKHKLLLACGLEKADRTELAPMLPRQALPLLMRCIVLPPGDAEVEAKAFNTAAGLASAVPWRQLSGTLDAAATTRAVGKEVETL